MPLEKERVVFDKNLDAWIKQHPFKFVLIKDNDVIGFYDTMHEAFKKGTDQFGIELFFIEQIVPGKPVNVIFINHSNAA